jgi:predicted metalloprotease
MRWTPDGDNSDVEDRRDESGSDGGGGGGFGFGGMHIGIGGAIVLLVLSFVFKTNFLALLGGGSTAPTSSNVSRPAPGRPNTARDAAEKPLVEFVTFVLHDTQKTWTTLLPEQTGKQYRHATLVLFRNSTYSGCGTAEEATGPFYCPSDEKVYIDLDFYDELKRRFGAPGEFAQAYVIAHELGHHVQNILGIERKVRQMQGNNPRTQNPLSVKMELQADCFAGIWAHTTQQRGLLEQGDIDSALGAAAAVGDDRLQKMATGHVTPDSFTHGTSAQRMMWFRKGFDSGTIVACDTFGQ